MPCTWCASVSSSQWIPFYPLPGWGALSSVCRHRGSAEWCVCDGQDQQLERSCGLQGMYAQAIATGETGIWGPAIGQVPHWVQPTLYWVNLFCEWLQVKLRDPSTHKHTQARAVHMFCYWCQFWTFVSSLVSRQKCLCFSKLCSSLKTTLLRAVCCSASGFFATCMTLAALKQAANG